LIEALNIYFSETGDTVPFSKLSRDHWSASAKANQLRQHLWEYEDLGSKGAAHALERFNIGKQTKFSELIPGDLFKINRTSGPGHSTVFIAYIDRVGNVLERYSDQVKGVLYFSAQETGGQDLNDSPSNGFGFRKEYFQGNCPDEEVRSANHCNIFPVGSDDEPNVGHMPHPKVWGDVGSNYRRELTAKAYLAQTGEPMPANFVGFMATLDANAKSALQTKVDLQLNKSLDPERFGNFEGP
jgi:hypothetical protein